jgi:hypothetical protein
MAWGWLQSWSAQIQTSSGGTQTVTATAGSNCTSGSTMIACVALSYGTSSTCSGVTDSHSNAFVKIATSGYNNGQETSLWALNTPAADAGTKAAITASNSAGGGPYMDIVVVEFSGIVTSTTQAGFTDGTPGVTHGSNNTGSGSGPTYSSTTANQLLVACYGDDGGPLTWTIPTTPSGYKNDNNGGTAKGFNNDSNADCELAFTNSTTGSQSGAWGLSGTATGWGTILTAFKLSAAAPAYYPFARQSPHPSRIRAANW